MKKTNIILNTDLYGITAEEYSRGRSNIEVVKKMIEADIKVIQYREKDKKNLYKYQECLEIRKLTADAGVIFIVNDDIDIAMAVEADGVHIGQEDMPISAVRSLIPDNMIIGLSTHSVEQAQVALKQGADYIGVGPIFATNTKKDVCDPVGFTYLEYVAENIDLPFVAIGGIKRHNIKEVQKRGAKCICLVTEIVEAEDIVQRVAEIRDILAR
ncbi:thiamine phosphate synthase [Desulfuribacillus alkaliarsenatis]|uniref:Thiamine-phosphate synthase n=1 Tax=Desulfuribacillus alkaliarsenatis TaxID=766136 RepID=A0A1E5G022_9FIRM|nr:thiamine phosphate synthase [Desulfuribacillus alkaliarsenatis]OEF96181.1 thiamine-phosphate diphosphorylase [Desulfuribacillus alkaliarsenatis]